ncbi:MAG: hypothetical protein LAN63_16475 [Acidobacteriia bacterium]|nr:hypothetical protein [Terriglobia bacterium]
MLSTALFVLWLAGASLSYGENLKPEDIVAKSLDSMGTTQVRTSAKSRVNEGTVQFRVLSGGVGNLAGKGVLVSQGRKLQFFMKFPNNDYRGEQFVTDGDKVRVAATTSRQNRSSLGQFVFSQDVIVKEGLLGGELSTAWPLLNLQERKAKLSYEGEKTIDGKKLLDVRYKPKKSSDLDIHLYFEPDTYRHVMTVYTLRIRPGIGHVDEQLSNAQATGADLGPSPIATGGVVTESSETATAHGSETRYRLEEHFSDFKTVDGLTLPSHYNIHFTQELGNGPTTVSEWDITTDQINNNVTLDPKNFEVK